MISLQRSAGRGLVRAALRPGRVRRPRDARRTVERDARAARLGWDEIEEIRHDARPLDAALHHRPLPRRLRALLGRLAPRQPDDHGLRALRRDPRLALRAAAARGRRHLRRRAVRRAARADARGAAARGRRQARRALHERRLGDAPAAAGVDRARCSTARRPSSSAPTRSTRRACRTRVYVNAARAIAAAGRLDRRAGDRHRADGRAGARAAARGVRRATARTSPSCALTAPLTARPRRRRVHAHATRTPGHAFAPCTHARLADGPLRRARHGAAATRA